MFGARNMTGAALASLGVHDGSIRGAWHGQNDYHAPLGWALRLFSACSIRSTQHGRKYCSGRRTWPEQLVPCAGPSSRVVRGKLAWPEQLAHSTAELVPVKQRPPCLFTPNHRCCCPFTGLPRCIAPLPVQLTRFLWKPMSWSDRMILN